MANPNAPKPDGRLENVQAASLDKKLAQQDAEIMQLRAALERIVEGDFDGGERHVRIAMQQVAQTTLLTVPKPDGRIAELEGALRDVVEIERRDSLTDPDQAATDWWREEAWANVRAALAKAPRS